MISEVRKLNVVAQKRSGRPRKSWDEVIKNDRKKLDMDSADPQNRSEWRGRLRGRLVKKPNPWKRKTGSKTDMMMMMMITMKLNSIHFSVSCLVHPQHGLSLIFLISLSCLFSPSLSH